ncbi:hypothetical protein GCM10025868_16630 [Angustibacter aerolatus]|uniref:Uncharacterized protein n=1 Tax=Angustibacter aerolatus TaxID=1162965 RepID=A0ABQ6JE21_9ACTN|nr:hypothetical protein GCM10025868_16630 [Angustibacter aerolatus]
MPSSLQAQRDVDVVRRDDGQPAVLRGAAQPGGGHAAEQAAGRVHPGPCAQQRRAGRGDEQVEQVQGGAPVVDHHQARPTRRAPGSRCTRPENTSPTTQGAAARGRPVVAASSTRSPLGRPSLAQVPHGRAEGRDVTARHDVGALAEASGVVGLEHRQQAQRRLDPGARGGHVPHLTVPGCTTRRRQVTGG